MREVAITTTDNPYDPLDQFEDWYDFDFVRGYCTCNYLDRIARTSNQMSEEENDEEIERAIDEIVSYDLVSLETNGKVHYKKVVHDSSN